MPKESDYRLIESNRNINAGLLGRRVEKTIAFDGGSGSGATGTVALFTVTGTVLCQLVAVCTEALVGASATIKVGIASSAAAFIAQTTATNIDAEEIWHDNSPDAKIESTSILSNKILNVDDIIATVATQDITDGTIKFILTYTPLSDDGSVVAT